MFNHMLPTVIQHDCQRSSASLLRFRTCSPVFEYVPTYVVGEDLALTASPPFGCTQIPAQKWWLSHPKLSWLHSASSAKSATRGSSAIRTYSFIEEVIIFPGNSVNVASRISGGGSMSVQNVKIRNRINIYNFCIRCNRPTNNACIVQAGILNKRPKSLV